MLKDINTKANKMFFNIKYRGHKNLKTVAPPINIEDVKRVSAKRAPKLGEHTKRILLEMGYSNDEIRQFKRIGVIS